MVKKTIIMIDDDDYFLSKWQQTLGTEIELITYISLSDFEDDLIDGNPKATSSECIIVDFEFGNTNAGKRDFANYIRDEHNYQKPILLCSLHDSFGEYDQLIRESFDSVIDKTPLTWAELSKILKSSKGRNSKEK